MNSRIRRMSLLSVAALVTLTPAAASAGPQPGVPVAQAFDGDRPLPSTSRAVEQCAADPGNCRFRIDPGASREYYSAVKSLGNAVINCTDDPITVQRQVTLRTGSTDNLGGEITGSITVEGQVNASGEVSAQVTGEGSGTFTTPNTKEGPYATLGAKGGATGSGKLAGSLGAKGAFQGAFKLHYQRSWTTENTESTSYTTTVRSGDALVFGASSAMQRVAGKITAGSGLEVRDVVVDGPSTVNTSTFVADTFTVPGNTCERLRPAGRTAVDDTTNRPTRMADLSTVLPALPRGARLKEHTVFAFERS
ncbi:MULTISPECIES: hypothetical protein [Streptosporangium]|uniref:Dirigent protein n=1 Tax=Streptosporangium brasiliense TaxID=47480 RepID=A0ABT9R878_9ACTN|nr:hypothetical protein [Streptosporangium brasiliense]MDP9865443.1 hypothetical protein [Streptosporangium brasiliense]